MAKVKGQTFTAPRCRILVDGKIIARGTNVSFEVQTEYADIDVIDSVETVEFAPVGYKVSGTIGLVGLVGTTPKSMGLIPQTGKNAEDHLLNILLHDESVMQLLDKGEERTIVTLTRVVFQSHGFQVSARGVAGRNVSFKAIRETDESEATT